MQLRGQQARRTAVEFFQGLRVAAAAVLKGSVTACAVAVQTVDPVEDLLWDWTTNSTTTTAATQTSAPEALLICL